MKNKERSFWEIVKKFFEPLFYDKKIALKALLFSLIESIINISFIFLIKQIVDKITGQILNGIDILYGIFIALVIIKALSIFYYRNLGGTFYPSIRKFFYQKYLTNYTKLDNNAVEKIGIGKVIGIFQDGWGKNVDLLYRFFKEAFPGFILIIFSIIFIFFINIYYGLCTIILVFIIIFNTYFLQNKAQKIRKERKELNLFIMRKVVKIIQAKFEILQNSKIKTEVETIKFTLNKNIKVNTRESNYTVVTELLIHFLINGSKAGIIGLFIFGFASNSISIGEFVALMGVIAMLEQIFSRFVSIYLEFNKSYVDLEKMWDFFDNTPQIQGYETGKSFEYKTGNIEIKNLSFAYTEGKNIFDNFNLKIAGGKVLALVGNSGSGKSTLVKLISGYIKGDSGKIIVDSQDLSEVSLKSFYQNIGYLTQEPSVFDGTILENLMYGTPPTSLCEVSPSVEGDKNGRDVWEKHLSNIISLAKCEFIYDLPKGIETEIGERGVRLSGGQRQRLAIAKIMLKDPKIIILDEPTSALDSFSEEQVSESLHNLFVGRTVIIIAHRLQTVKKADRILVLEAGKVVEEGTHDSLITQNGIYKKMLDLQSGF